jgi:hypothetical protein
MAIVPVLLALGLRQRGRRGAAGYLTGIATGPEEILRALAEPGERSRRVWALESLSVRGLLTPGRLLGSAQPGVRAFAAARVVSALLTRPLLGGLLLDRSGAVRSVAAGGGSSSTGTRDRPT